MNWKPCGARRYEHAGESGRADPSVSNPRATTVCDTLDAFYEQVGASVQGAGGRVVKCKGDAVLIAFDESYVDRGVESLLSLREAGLLRDRGLWAVRAGWRQAV